MFLVPAVLDLTSYTSAVTEVVDAIKAAVPTVAIAAMGIAAGILVLQLGLRFLKKFVK